MTAWEILEDMSLLCCSKDLQEFVDTDFQQLEKIIFNA